MAEYRSDLTSNKGKKKRSYTMEFKKHAVPYAEEKNNQYVASHYGVKPKREGEWKKDLNKN